MRRTSTRHPKSEAPVHVLRGAAPVEIIEEQDVIFDGHQTKEQR